MNHADIPTGQSTLRRRWAALAAGLILAAALIVGAWALCNVLPYSILRPSRAERWNVYHGCIPADFGLRADDMWVEAEPGLWLRGWHVAATGSPRGTIVLLHGSSSCKEALIHLAKLFCEHGYNCLFYDSRAHGESGGVYCTFGYYERRDVSQFIDEAQRRFGPPGPLAIYGNSMGAAIALQTMAVEPRIRCGVVESPFATLREIVRDYVKHYSWIGISAFSDIALWRAGQIARFPVNSVNPEASAGILSQPVLLAHGTSDHWIAFRYGERVFHRLTSPKSQWRPVQGADHGDVWKVGGAAYQQAVLDFFDRQCR